MKDNLLFQSETLFVFRLEILFQIDKSLYMNVSNQFFSFRFDPDHGSKSSL